MPYTFKLCFIGGYIGGYEDMDPILPFDVEAETVTNRNTSEELSVRKKPWKEPLEGNPWKEILNDSSVELKKGAQKKILP